MDLVNFLVGPKTVALPILNILLTERYEQNLTEIPNENPSFIGVKDFMNTPVPVFDLGKILNGGSTSDSNKTLSQRLRDLQKDSNNWVKSLSLDGDSQISPELTEYSKWLSDFNCDNEDLLSLLQRILEPMTDIYTLSKEPATSADAASNWARAQSNCQSHIHRLFDSAIEQVDVGYKPIIVFTTTNGRDPHVGLLVDKVEDSLHVEETDIKKLDSVTSVGFQLDKQTTSMMQGLVQLENKHSLIIDPSAIFADVA